MVDGWMGDDWFHNGAFRVTSLSYATTQVVNKGDGGGEFALGKGTITPAGWKPVRWAISPPSWALRKCRAYASGWKTRPIPGSGRNRRWTSGWRPAR
jgi:hypothetical protein